MHLFWGRMNWAEYWLQKATMLSLGCHTMFQVGKWNTHIYLCVHIHVWLSCLNLYLWSSSLATISFGKLARRLVFQKQFIFIDIHDYWSIQQTWSSSESCSSRTWALWDCVWKAFFIKYELFFFEINIFLIFSNHFDVLILKIIFKK